MNRWSVASVLVQGTSTEPSPIWTVNIQSLSPRGRIGISYVGMTTQSVKVGAQNVINVTLKRRFAGTSRGQSLSDTVARRKETDRFITNVKGEEIANKPATNPLSSLQGKVAGVQIVNSDVPGPIRNPCIRGTNSINGYKTGTLSTVYSMTISTSLIRRTSNLWRSWKTRHHWLSSVFAVANGCHHHHHQRKPKKGQTLVNINTSFGFKKVVDKGWFGQRSAISSYTANSLPIRRMTSVRLHRLEREHRLDSRLHSSPTIISVLQGFAQT